MKNVMRKLVNLFTTERHCLLLDKFEVLDVLDVAGNRARGLGIRGCDEKANMRYVDLDVTEREWAYIQSKLTEKGYHMFITGDPDVLYLTKKVES